jgi:hypothetical protein
MTVTAGNTCMWRDQRLSQNVERYSRIDHVIQHCQTPVISPQKYLPIVCGFICKNIIYCLAAFTIYTWNIQSLLMTTIIWTLLETGLWRNHGSTTDPLQKLAGRRTPSTTPHRTLWIAEPLATNSKSKLFPVSLYVDKENKRLITSFKTALCLNAKISEEDLNHRFFFVWIGILFTALK